MYEHWIFRHKKMYTMMLKKKGKIELVLTIEIFCSYFVNYL
jgi:hypothetical protein